MEPLVGKPLGEPTQSRRPSESERYNICEAQREQTLSEIIRMRARELREQSVSLDKIADDIERDHLSKDARDMFRHLFLRQ